MNLEKIAIKNYRNIDADGLIIDSPNKINLFIGKNNSGKSNLLKFLYLLGENSSIFNSVQFGSDHVARSRITIDEFRDYNERNQIRFSIYIKLEDNFKEKLLGIIPSDDVYLTYQLEMKNGNTIIKLIDSFIHHLPETTIRAFEERYVSKHGGTSGGSLPDAQKRVANILNISSQVDFPKVEYIDEYRNLKEDRKLKERLKLIIDPSYLKQENIVKKKILCSYFKTVFGFDVDIKIPDLEKEIELVIGGKQYPLSSIGAGLHQVILLAFKIVTTDAPIICIDEPELHIHPGAQRELVNLFSGIEDKIFFLATHSNHFLDYEVPNKKVYQLIKDGDIIKIGVVDNESGFERIIDDLGIRASEIYQTNGIIWVEGPSDRIYIKKWLQLLAPELKEGLQYSFQYYGGKMLSHYSLDDSEFKDYLNIFFINKKAYFVMDSDEAAPYTITSLRDTKQRIITECERNGTSYWVTKGREIENYLTDRSLTEFSKQKITRNIFQPVEQYYPAFDKNKKVSFSREISNHITIDDVKNNEDAEEKVREIISVIKIWND